MKILLILALSFAGNLMASQVDHPSKKAGRILLLDEKLPAAALELLDPAPGTLPAKKGLILFTRQGQKHSIRLKSGLLEHLNSKHLKIPVWEFLEKGPVQDRNSAPVKRKGWKILHDTGRKAAAIFGVKAYPSTFIIDSQTVLREYHAGYFPNILDEIRIALDSNSGRKEAANLAKVKELGPNRLEAFAQKLFEKGQSQKALNQLKKDKKKTPMGRLLQARIYLSMGSNSAAAREFQSLEKILPDHWMSKLGLAILDFRKGKFEKGLQKLSTLKKADTKRSEVRYWKGRMMIALKKEQEALDLYRTTLENLDPVQPWLTEGP